ncbi:MAG: hypothetical protein PHS64_03600 [Candidatus Omnitrophica bacterium]|nr:hypothetical protein [Candidatus Omnitrophota bacterium]MDD5775010.1 hypothetical protein [Candidatus Omnitrophota bacterium]
MKKRTSFTIPRVCFPFLVWVCLALVFALFYRRAFTMPMRSDWWAFCYQFHHLGALADGPVKWLYLFQVDPWHEAGFRPLTFLVLYLEHAAWGARFLFYNIANISFFALALAFLVILLKDFIGNRFLPYVAVGVTAFLFSHMDILLGNFHIYILIGFCMFAYGFHLYITHIRKGGIWRLWAAGLLFLGGALFYEAYLVWPLACFILMYAFGREDGYAARAFRTILLAAAVYGIYALIWWYVRQFPLYVNPVSKPASYLSWALIGDAFALSVFSFIYNGVVINAMPFLAFPLSVGDNLELGGALARVPAGTLAGIARAVAAAGVCALCVFVCHSIRRGRGKLVLRSMFFLFLPVAVLFGIYLGRIPTNTVLSNLIQFRHMFFINIGVVSCAAVLIDASVSMKGRSLLVIVIGAAAILAVNVSASTRAIAIVDEQLSPLESLVANIRRGIHSGMISRDRRLYIPGDIARSLPPLCWNREMGAFFMKGTYQWALSERDIEKFTSLDQAAWVIEPQGLSIIPKKTEERF